MAYIQTYNTENRISSIIKLASGSCAAPGPFAAKWDFAYDGDGVRVSTLLTPYDETGAPLTPEMTAYYFGGAYETRSDGTTIKYYSFAGQTIGMDDGTGLQYFLTDHLGSVVAVTDASGTLTSQQRYLPFGGVRPNVPTPSGPNTDLGYTGQRNLDADIGLMDYKARFYSPYINRFVQPDSLVPNPANPQAYNRYSYVYNRPINFSDPSGHDPWWLPQDLQDDYWQNSWLVQSSNLDGGNDSGDEDGIDPEDMKTSEEGEDFIIFWETAGNSYAEQPYPDLGGYCTIGYGHRLSSTSDGCSGDLKKYYRANPLSKSGAEYFLSVDIGYAEKAVINSIRAKLTQAQFDALVSYVLNSGGELNSQFHVKGIPELINSGNYQEAAMAIDSGPYYSKDTYSSALEARRHAETELFLYGIYVP